MVTIRTIRDGEPRTATSTFTHLLRSNKPDDESVCFSGLDPLTGVGCVATH